jgi:hypothetical protein
MIALGVVLALSLFASQTVTFEAKITQGNSTRTRTGEIRWENENCLISVQERDKTTSVLYHNGFTYTLQTYGVERPICTIANGPRSGLLGELPLLLQDLGGIPLIASRKGENASFYLRDSRDAKLGQPVQILGSIQESDSQVQVKFLEKERVLESWKLENLTASPVGPIPTRITRTLDNQTDSYTLKLTAHKPIPNPSEWIPNGAEVSDEANNFKFVFQKNKGSLEDQIALQFNTVDSPTGAKFEYRSQILLAVGFLAFGLAGLVKRGKKRESLSR